MFADAKHLAAATPDPSGLVDQVGGALRSGDLAEAVQLLRMRLLWAPNDVNAIVKLADLLIAQCETAEAVTHLYRALAIAPVAHQLRLQLALLQQQLGQFPLALTLIEQLPVPVRGAANVKMQEAALLGQLGRREQEIGLYQELLAERPREPRLWISLGNALNYAGRSKEAVRALRRAAHFSPSSGEPFWSLANLKSFRFEDRDIGAMKRALNREITTDNAVFFHFALGKAFEERAKYPQSFEHYLAGNQLQALKLGPEQMRVTEFVDAAIATFDRAFFDHYRQAGCHARDPIFIIGLQRSGSTLIEQILASHPQIEGTTELLAMQQLSDEVARLGVSNGRNALQQLADFEPGAFRRIGEEYLERTKAIRQLGRPFFVDKLPANWLKVGLIRLALPNARIIDARRHPMACGFSNFKQLYAHGVTYAYSLSSIGCFYNDYLRQMDHFDQVQPGAIHHLVNERLIENPEREIQRLLEYVGVPFEPACLDFHRTKRAVHTPSAEQVRRPINRDGMDVWRPFQQWLGPLEEALGPTLGRWLPAPV